MVFVQQFVCYYDILLQYCSGGELFDYIVAKERLKVRVFYLNQPYI